MAEINKPIIKSIQATYVNISGGNFCSFFNEANMNPLRC